MLLRAGAYSTPSNTTHPVVGGPMKFTQRSSVDLPDPLGPMTQTTSPRRTVRSVGLSTWASPKDLVT